MSVGWTKWLQLAFEVTNFVKLLLKLGYIREKKQSIVWWSKELNVYGAGQQTHKNVPFSFVWILVWLIKAFYEDRNLSL